MSAPVHRVPDTRVPMVAAIVSGAALLVGTVGVLMLAAGIS